jgi:hypothetical protein
MVPSRFLARGACRNCLRRDNTNALSSISPIGAHNIAINMVPWAEGAYIIDAFDDDELISLSPEDDDDVYSLCSSFSSDEDSDDDHEEELQHTRKKLCIAFIAHGILKNKELLFLPKDVV